MNGRRGRARGSPRSNFAGTIVADAIGLSLAASALMELHRPLGLVR